MRRLTLIITLMLIPICAYAAIDSAAKRASACGDKDLFPDNAIDAGDRAQICGDYRGFSDIGSGGGPGTGVTMGGSGFLDYFHRRRR